MVDGKPFTSCLPRGSLNLTLYEYNTRVLQSYLVFIKEILIQAMKISNNTLAVLLSLTATSNAARIPFVTLTSQLVRKPSNTFVRQVLCLRGGEESTETATNEAMENKDDLEDEESLEDKVHAAMRRLGLSPDGSSASDAASTSAAASDVEEIECKNGACALPADPKPPLEDAMTMTKRLSIEMEVDETIVYAALGATMMPGEGSEEERLNEIAAREMIKNEMNAIARVMEDCDEVRE